MSLFGLGRKEVERIAERKVYEYFRGGSRYDTAYDEPPVVRIEKLEQLAMQLGYEYQPGDGYGSWVKKKNGKK